MDSKKRLSFGVCYLRVIKRLHRLLGVDMKIEMRVLPNEKSGEVFGVQRNKAPDLFRRAVRIFTGMVNGTTDRIYIYNRCDCQAGIGQARTALTCRIKIFTEKSRASHLKNAAYAITSSAANSQGFRLRRTTLTHNTRKRLYDASTGAMDNGDRLHSHVAARLRSKSRGGGIYARQRNAVFAYSSN